MPFHTGGLCLPKVTSQSPEGSDLYSYTASRVPTAFVCYASSLVLLELSCGSNSMYMASTFNQPYHQEFACSIYIKDREKECQYSVRFIKKKKKNLIKIALTCCPVNQISIRFETRECCPGVRSMGQMLHQRNLCSTRLTTPLQELQVQIPTLPNRSVLKWSPSKGVRSIVHSFGNIYLIAFRLWKGKFHLHLCIF